MTPKETKRVLKYLIENNKELAKEGKSTISVEIEGPAGISKTSICEEIAQENGLNFIKITPSMFEDTGD